MPEFSELDFFDCNCMVGRSGTFREGMFSRVSELRQAMDYYRIGSAMVFHVLSKEYHPSVGNRLILEELRGHDNLFPVWALLPPHTHEFGEVMRSPEDIVRGMVRQGVRMARLYPSAGNHNFPLREWCVGSLFSALEERRLPVMMDLDQLTWDDAASICSAHPRLPLILSRVGYRVDRALYPLLERFSNLYIEISGYQVHRGLESICERFGPNRLIFGTGMPFWDPGPPIMMVTHAQIGEDARRLIAGGNLRGLLERVVLDG